MALYDGLGCFALAVCKCIFIVRTHKILKYFFLFLSIFTFIFATVWARQSVTGVSLYLFNDQLLPTQRSGVRLTTRLLCQGVLIKLCCSVHPLTFQRLQTIIASVQSFFYVCFTTLSYFYCCLLTSTLKQRQRDGEAMERKRKNLITSTKQ